MGNAGSCGTGVLVSGGCMSQGTQVLISRHTWKAMLSTSASVCCHAYGSCSRSFQSPTPSPSTAVCWPTHLSSACALLLLAQLLEDTEGGGELLWCECLCSSQHQILAAHQAAGGFETGFSSLLRVTLLLRYWMQWEVKKKGKNLSVTKT